MVLEPRITKPFVLLWLTQGVSDCLRPRRLIMLGVPLPEYSVENNTMTKELQKHSGLERLSARGGGRTVWPVAMP